MKKQSLLAQTRKPIQMFLKIHGELILPENNYRAKFSFKDFKGFVNCNCFKISAPETNRQSGLRRDNMCQLDVWDSSLDLEIGFKKSTIDTISQYYKNHLKMNDY